MGVSESTIPELKDPQKGEPCALLIDGVVESWSSSRFGAFLRRISINFKSITKTIGHSSAIIYFNNNGDRQDAYYFLHDCNLAGKNLILKPYIVHDPPPMPYATQAEILKYKDLNAQSFTHKYNPFIEMTKDQRLQQKLKSIKAPLYNIASNMDIDIVTEDKEYFRSIELVVGYASDGSIKVGLNSSSRKNPIILPIPNTQPQQFIDIATTFESFLSISRFPPYDSNSRTGKWHALYLRLSTLSELMVTVVTNGGLPNTEIKRLIQTFSDKCQSLHWVKGDDTVTIQSPNRVLCGTALISEKIKDLVIHIHHFSYFPSNLATFNLHIDYIAKYLNEQTVFIDACCGIGLQCLSVSNLVKRAVGIDSNDQFINIAQTNAESSNINNAYFVTGSSGKVLADLINNISTSETAVCYLDTSNLVDQGSQLQSIASCASLTTFIYVIDNAATFSTDYLMILEPSGFILKEVKCFEDLIESPKVKIVGIFQK